jgi:hypothetical protein
LFTDGSSFVGSEGRIAPESPTQKLRLPIVNSIIWFLSTSELLLAKSEHRPLAPSGPAHGSVAPGSHRGSDAGFGLTGL